MARAAVPTTRTGRSVTELRSATRHDRWNSVKEQERRHGTRHRACDHCRIFRRECNDTRSAGRRRTKLGTISV